MSCACLGKHNFPSLIFNRSSIYPRHNIIVFFSLVQLSNRRLTQELANNSDSSTPMYIPSDTPNKNVKILVESFLNQELQKKTTFWPAWRYQNGFSWVWKKSLRVSGRGQAMGHLWVGPPLSLESKMMVKIKNVLACIKMLELRQIRKDGVLFRVINGA